MYMIIGGKIENMMRHTNTMGLGEHHIFKQTMLNLYGKVYDIIIVSTGHEPVGNNNQEVHLPCSCQCHSAAVSPSHFPIISNTNHKNKKQNRQNNLNDIMYHAFSMVLFYLFGLLLKSFPHASCAAHSLRFQFIGFIFFGITCWYRFHTPFFVLVYIYAYTCIQIYMHIHVYIYIY